jgi:hypothetical protein
MKIFLEKLTNFNKANKNLSNSEKVTEMSQWFTESFLNIVKDEDENDSDYEDN